MLPHALEEREGKKDPSIHRSETLFMDDLRTLPLFFAILFMILLKAEPRAKREANRKLLSLAPFPTLRCGGCAARLTFIAFIYFYCHRSL